MPESIFTESIRIEGTDNSRLTQDRYSRLEQFNTLEEAFEKFTKQPAVREAIENHKSNWVANSKGGEPNHTP